jgi:hypothetical protein
MFKVLVAALLAALAMSGAAFAHGGSALGPCGPLGTVSLFGEGTLTAPTPAAQPLKPPSKHGRKHVSRN